MRAFLVFVSLALAAFAPSAAAEEVDLVEVWGSLVGPDGPDPPGQTCRPTCRSEEGPPTPPGPGPGS